MTQSKQLSKKDDQLEFQDEIQCIVKESKQRVRKQ